MGESDEADKAAASNGVQEPSPSIAYTMEAPPAQQHENKYIQDYLASVMADVKTITSHPAFKKIEELPPLGLNEGGAATTFADADIQEAPQAHATDPPFQSLLAKLAVAVLVNHVRLICRLSHSHTDPARSHRPIGHAGGLCSDLLHAGSRKRCG